MARNFYVGKFWFETSRLAYGFKAKTSLRCRPEPGGRRARLSNKLPFWIKPGTARNFYFGKFWFETSRFAYGFKPNILLEAIRTRTPPYSNGVVHRTLSHSKERGWVETRPSLRLEVKSRLRDEVQPAG